MTPKEFLQNKYPEMRGNKWNSNEIIDDNWIAKMMQEYKDQELSSRIVIKSFTVKKIKSLARSIWNVLPSF